MFEGLPIEQQVPLAPFTTFKIGGPAKYFLRAKTLAELLQALTMAQSSNMAVYILGGGSNVLVHDRGFDGLVIKMELHDISITTTRLTAGAGVLLNTAIRLAVNAGLAGLEFATGVPASVGGAVWANLGCRGSDISQIVESVVACDRQGNQKIFTRADCQFQYRDSMFKHQPWIILQASFQLHFGDNTALRQRMVALTKLKKNEQNVGEDTAGCAFRNPINSTASQLIDQLGLKGFQIGGAKVSERHANFIINTGQATADQVVQLISYIKQQVRDQLGVQLQEEIEYVGF
ncbi:MAG: UDP-N-acetylmuramate dehydrogenase [Candidatus Kerfeldbacteria bacterium]|nr:UDP-N-acetylmuramate dehydrogenase [Candidatus Kerfeldbacteria bacterium]